MANNNEHLTITQHPLCARPHHVLIPIPPEGRWGRVGEVPQVAQLLSAELCWNRGQSNSEVSALPSAPLVHSPHP